jgi:hypothetical protein
MSARLPSVHNKCANTTKNIQLDHFSLLLQKKKFIFEKIKKLKNYNMYNNNEFIYKFYIKVYNRLKKKKTHRNSYSSAQRRILTTYHLIHMSSLSTEMCVVVDFHAKKKFNHFLLRLIVHCCAKVTEQSQSFGVSMGLIIWKLED